MMGEREIIKCMIRNAYHKKKLLTFVSSYSDCYVKLYDKTNKGHYILAFFSPRFLIEIAYSYDIPLVEVYIDELTKEEVKAISKYGKDMLLLIRPKKNSVVEISMREKDLGMQYDMAGFFMAGILTHVLWRIMKWYFAEGGD